MRKNLSFRLLFSTLFLLLPLDAFAQTSLAEMAPRIARELVKVQSRERPERQGQSYDPYFYFFKQPVPAGQGIFQLGTGFILPGGKHVATSARSLENLSDVEVVAGDGKPISAKVVGIDLTLDLALLALSSPTKKFSGVDFGDSKQSRIGDQLYVFGRSVKYLMLRTALSATEPSEGPYGRHWTIDQPTSPAVAGGPLVDSRGRVVGMAVYNPKGPDQLGTVLPAHLIIQATRQLLKFGKPDRAWLGVALRSQVSIDELDSIRDAEVKGGVLIENLIIDGPAAKAGLQIGDFIMAIEGKTMAAISDLFELLDRRKAGEILAIKIFRSGKGVMEIKLRLGDLPNARELPNTENLL